MTATDIQTSSADTFEGGFGASAPAANAAPATPTPATKPAVAAPVAPAAANPAAPAVTDPNAKPATSLIAAAAEAPKYELKAEGIHADDLKLFTTVLGEGKVDPKAGQAILDKMLPALSARREAANKEQWEAIQKDWREQNAKDPQLDPSKPENAARAKLALDILGADLLGDITAAKLVDHPAFNRMVARFGAFVEKATKQDTAVPGTSPSAAPKFDPSNTTSAAFAAGVNGGF